MASVLLAVLVLSPQEQAVPRFRSGVDVVLLDVTVLDKDRRPARGLRAADFTILEDGKPQPIVSFDEVDSPEPDGSLVPWMREVAPDVRTNYGEERRLILLVLDDASIAWRDRPHTKQIGNTVIDQLGPADQVAVIYTGNNAKSQEFTSNRKLLRAAVERFTDTSMSGPTGGAEASLDVIERAVDAMAAVKHRRKAMIFVSSVAVDLGQAGEYRYRLQRALRQAQRANVTIYPVNPAGLEVYGPGAAERGISGQLPPFRGLARDDVQFFAAAETGAFPIINTNGFKPQLQQIFRETGSYYLLGFQSAHRDGKFRRIEVKTNRVGLSVRTRSGYEAPSANEKPKSDKALPLIKALSSVLPSSDVPMRVVLAPFAAPGSREVVTIALGLQQPVLSDRIVETVELVSTAFNVGHRQAGFYRQTVQMTLRRTPDGSDAKYEVLSKLDLAPGRYNMRFAASSVFRGKSGSVFEEIEIPDFNKEPLSMSGVVMSVSPALPAAPKTFLASIVPVQPTTQRVFLAGHKPAAFLRVYQGGKKPRVPIVLTTTIVDDQDRTAHTAKETLDAARFIGEAGVEHYFDLPVDRLTPGAYLLRFEATGAAKPVIREVRFVIR